MKILINVNSFLVNFSRKKIERMMPLTRPLKNLDLLKLDEKELDQLYHELVLYEFNFAKKIRD